VSRRAEHVVRIWGLPPSANTINSAAQDAELNLIADPFGGNLNTAIAADKPTANCQSAVSKVTEKLFQT
jgi:hypothetical protein